MPFRPQDDDDEPVVIRPPFGRRTISANGTRGPSGNLLSFGLALLALFVTSTAASSFWVDWLWYGSLGLQSVYWTRLSTKVAVFLLFAAVFFVALTASVFAARLSRPSRAGQLLSEVSAPVQRFVRLGWLALGAVLSVLMGAVAVSEWSASLLFLHPSSFSSTDPIFGRDVSFYVFELPYLDFLQTWIFWSLILITAATALAYGITKIAWPLLLGRAATAHLSVLGALILGTVAWGYYLDTFGLLLSRRGHVFGATYTDVHAQLNAYRILMFIAIVSAILLVGNIFVRTLWMLGLVAVGWVLASIVLGNIYPGLVQRFQVLPNELGYERPFIENNIKMTRQAFGLDKIQEEAFPAEDRPSQEDLAQDAETIKNIRLWDYRPLLQTFGQIQTMRLYYHFNDVDIDRYVIDGQYRQVMLSARELQSSRLPRQAQTWVNQRLKFTHGYGLTMSTVNEVTSAGLPNLVVKDLPPVGSIPIERPEIYFGQDVSEYVIVDTRTEEFDYPRGDDNVYSRFQGNGGVKLDSLAKKIAFAWRFGDMNMMLSDYLTLESRVLFRRNITERARTIAPFLSYDRDPYIVVADGKLYWIQDAYTTSDRYPYSQPSQGGFNYIRNSVKVVTSAYEGSIAFYIADPTDPVLHTYQAIFPGLFTPMETMPASLQAHLRYPQDYFMAQVEMYRTYHMQDPQVFYNREDMWNVAREKFTGQEQPMEPYYVVMRLPGTSKPEFLLMLPFTPANKNNMVAWLSARSDGADYGKLLAYKFPKDKLVYGPLQVEARIDQDPTISQQLSLWDQKGSRVIRGNLLVVPVARSLLYVEPLYLQAETSSLPELKRVVVATQSSVVMGENLDQALRQTFGGQAPPASSPAAAAPSLPSPATAAAPSGQAPPADVASLTRSARQHYDRAQEYLKTADWAHYGQEMDALVRDLQQLERLTSSGR